MGNSNQTVLPWSALRPTHPCVVARRVVKLRFGHASLICVAFKCHRVSGLSLRASRSLSCDAPHRSREPTSLTLSVHYLHNDKG